jgi:hypothetical protein
MLRYNLAVTGTFLRMPYQEYVAQYDSAPMFVFQKPAPPIAYRHEDFRMLYMDSHFRMHESQQNLIGWLRGRPISTISPLSFFVGPVAFAMLWLPAALKRKPVKIAFISGLFLMLIHQSVIATVPHYIAPGACLIVLVITACMRELSVIRFGDCNIGRSCILYLMILLPICLAVVAKKRDHLMLSHNRGMIQQKLEATDGQHLVIVGSKPWSVNTFGWISNHPDIDRSKVIWAYDMGTAMNKELLDYFRDRKVWSVNTQSPLPALIDYDSN